MSTEPELLRRALKAIQDLERRLADEKARTRQPVAVIGMSCRFPGADSPGEFWRLLVDGRDMIGPFPRDRRGGGGGPSPWKGGFIEGIDLFDPRFFGISPREAETMDPQQRLVLEGAWHALEHAGQPARPLVGSSTGVFVGVTTSDYARLLQGAEDVYAATGGALNAISGRLSYVLGLQGPCMAVDTACSSSLVATHLACQSLRAGECDLALAAGVNALLSEEAFALFSKWGMLAPDGRCKTFDHRADGFTRGEGCGVLVLKRLADAERDGDRILALLHGSAVNQDGRSSGLSVPNGLAQEKVLRAALDRAGLEAGAVDYVEAHGTGTNLGDPIEVEALGAVYGSREAHRPLAIGSVKTNLGHLESASGVAGLCKLILSLHHETLPPHLHYESPNPRIPWGDFPVVVPTEVTPWPRGERPRYGGVSSFGFTGTNAHVIVGEAPAPAPRPAESTRPCVVPLSARSANALAGNAVRAATFLEEAGTGALRPVARGAGVGRDHHPFRWATVAGTPGEAAAALRERLEKGGVGPRREGPPRIAFLFSGQGAQRAGMGRELYETSQVARRVMDRCAEIAEGELPRPLLDAMFDPDPGTLRRTELTQPGLFALEAALAAQWRSWGVEPAAVAGHSLGEYVAAHVAGAMTLEEAFRLVVARGRAMGDLPDGGGMAVVFRGEGEVASLLEEGGWDLDVAGVNTPTSTVVSGSHDRLSAFCARLGEEEFRLLDVSHAFHSSLIEPALDPIGEAASGVRATPPRISLVRNVDGLAWPRGEAPDGAYWRRHAREAVRFEACVRTLGELGCDLFVEVGPGRGHLAMARRVLEGEAFTWVPSLDGDDEWRSLLTGLGQVYEAGADVDWTAVPDDDPGPVEALPGYAFERERYWYAPGTAETGSLRPGTAPPADDSIFYRVSWDPVGPAGEGDDAPLPVDGVLVLGAGSPTALAVVEELERRGCPAAMVRSTAAAGEEECGVVDPSSVEDWLRVLADAPGSDGRLGILHLWTLDGAGSSSLPSPLEATRDGMGSVAALTRALERSGRDAVARVVTRGASALSPSDRIDPIGAALASFCRGAGVEHPGLWAGTIDLDPSASAERNAASLVAALGDPTLERAVALRDGRLHVPRLRRVDRPARSVEPDWRGTCLITGGLGGIGLELARRLVERGCRDLVLVGRSVPPGGGQDERWTGTLAALEALEDAGARVTVRSVDVSDPEAVGALEEELAGEGRLPLRGLFHAAGVPGTGAVSELTPELSTALLAGKAEGARNLVETFADAGRTVFFSSASALLPPPTMAGYAAANAYLDALALQLRSDGRVATAIDWGAWGETGMALEAASGSREGHGSRGVLATSEALDALEDVIAAEVGQIAVMRLHWDAWRQRYPAFVDDPFFEDVVPTGAGPVDAGSDVDLSALGELDEEGRRGLLQEYLAACVGRTLGVAPHDLDRDISLNRLGFDSLMAVEIRNRVEDDLGLLLPMVRLIDAPSVRALAEELLARGATGAVEPAEADEEDWIEGDI